MRNRSRTSSEGSAKSAETPAGGEPRRRGRKLQLLFATVLTALVWFGGEALVRAAGDGTTGDPNYPATGNIHAGVWNGGKAAPWDLGIIDHFKYFGPEQRAAGYQPEQPILFSHVTHVQKNQMECQFCHWSVSKAAYAAIPEVENCMGCHQQVLGNTEQQKEEIAKIGKYYNANDPIPWVKVHVMPDYVRFNHKRHAKGGVSCQECHGQIPEMPVVERVSSMKMGWCIDCHRQRGASIDCATCHY